MAQHKRAFSREMTWRHAVRKRNICRKVYRWEPYDNLHQYSKNKIHCSCPDCSPKSNGITRCNSIVYRKISEQKKLCEMSEQEKEYRE